MGGDDKDVMGFQQTVSSWCNRTADSYDRLMDRVQRTKASLFDTFLSTKLAQNAFAYGLLSLWTLGVFWVVILGRAEMNAKVTQAFDAPMGPDSKVALMFLTKGDHAHARLWHNYLAPHSRYYKVVAHSKDPASIDRQSFIRRYQLRQNLPTEWGTISLVEASLALIRASLEEPTVSKLVLLSDACVPLVPFQQVREKLLADKLSWFHYETGPSMRPEHMARFDKVYGVDKSLYAHHSQWVVLSRKHAYLLVKHGQQYLDNFHAMFTPDEHFFLTVLRIAGVDLNMEVHNWPVTYVNWTNSAGMHPHTYDQILPEELQLLKSPPGSYSASLFARKFTPTSDIQNFHKQILDAHQH